MDDTPNTPPWDDGLKRRLLRAGRGWVLQRKHERALIKYRRLPRGHLTDEQRYWHARALQSWYYLRHLSPPDASHPMEGYQGCLNDAICSGNDRAIHSMVDILEKWEKEERERKREEGECEPGEAYREEAEAAEEAVRAATVALEEVRDKAAQLRLDMKSAKKTVSKLNAQMLTVKKEVARRKKAITQALREEEAEFGRDVTNLIREEMLSACEEHGYRRRDAEKWSKPLKTIVNRRLKEATEAQREVHFLSEERYRSFEASWPRDSGRFEPERAWLELTLNTLEIEGLREEMLAVCETRGYPRKRIEKQITRLRKDWVENEIQEFNPEFERVRLDLIFLVQDLGLEDILEIPPFCSKCGIVVKQDDVLCPRCLDGTSDLEEEPADDGHP